MKCDLCPKTTDALYRMMPLCDDCKEKVKETRRKRREIDGSQAAELSLGSKSQK